MKDFRSLQKTITTLKYTTKKLHHELRETLYDTSPELMQVLASGADGAGVEAAAAEVLQAAREEAQDPGRLNVACAALRLPRTPSEAQAEHYQQHHKVQTRSETP